MLFARVITRLGGCLLLSGIAFAKDNFLPDRVTPVPRDQPIPIVDFVRPLVFEKPVLNPAGTHFAALSKNEDLKTTLLVCEIATGKVEWSLGGVWRFDWISDRHLLVNHFGGNNQLHPAAAFANSTGFALELGRLDKPLDELTLLPRDKRGVQPGTGFLWEWPPGSLLHRSNVFLERYWVRPEDGNVGYCQVITLSGKRILQRNTDGKWVDCPVDMEEITPLTISASPDEMIVLGPRTKGKPRALQRMDVVTGKLLEIIYQDPEYDCVPQFSRKRGAWEINGVRASNRAGRTIWLSETMRQAQSLLDRQFPGTVVEILSTDTSESRFLVEVQSDRQPPLYYFFDQAGKTVGLLKNAAPWFEPDRMSATQVMTYKARDGVTLEGYLTLPASASPAHPVPLVVTVHPGPWQYRTLWEWDAYVQFLASRGYAVFQPNYRGSLGYDARIEPADRYDFGKMSDDVTDGVRTLIKSGRIDPNRIAAHGTGFGGYLAMCGALAEPTLYRCAILYGGTYDWDRAFALKDSRTMFEDDWLRQQLAAHGRIPPSPLQRRAEIKVPVFFARNAVVRDITFEHQADEMYRALKGQVPCVNFGDLDIYEISETYAESAKRFAAVEEFLGKYLPAK
jgi:dipeptidyl aminopeptidase/acylaminoacyl peptidase